jgi:hypothetical protein
MSAPTETSAGTAAIRPFTVRVTTKAELEALRARRGHPLARPGARQGSFAGPEAGGHRPLANPTAHGGTAADAFDVVIPSMLYGFCPDTGHN